MHYLKSRKQGCETLTNQYLKILYFPSQQSILASTALAEAYKRPRYKMNKTSNAMFHVADKQCRNLSFVSSRASVMFITTMNMSCTNKINGSTCS
jgi:hypothetical protein